MPRLQTPIRRNDTVIVTTGKDSGKRGRVLKVIPVVILTTSQAEQDILRSYALHANAYVSKPVDFERFMEVIRQIDDFFVTVVQLAR